MTMEIRDFEDTAKVIELADLTITVDTSVAHLAGAIGTPLWLLTPTPGDWRWGLSGDSTPWYRCRLWRQDTPGDWRSVFARLEAELRTMTAQQDEAA